MHRHSSRGGGYRIFGLLLHGASCSLMIPFTVASLGFSITDPRCKTCKKPPFAFRYAMRRVKTIKSFLRSALNDFHSYTLLGTSEGQHVFSLPLLETISKRASSSFSSSFPESSFFPISSFDSLLFLIGEEIF